MFLTVKEIKIFMVDLKDHPLHLAKKAINNMGFSILRWEKDDNIYSKIYYAYCTKKEDCDDRSTG